MNMAMLASWSRFCKLYPKLRQYPKPQLLLSVRLYRNAGFAWVDNGQGMIQLGVKFIRQHPTIMFRQTLPHELAHIADTYLNGEKNPKVCHDDQWRDIMITYGVPPEQYHTMELTKC